MAEHLGASSRRPRHPFPALMAGVNHGRVPVYTALKTHPVMPRTAPSGEKNHHHTTRRRKHPRCTLETQRHAVCRRRARGHNSCSGIEGATCHRGCEGHRVRFHSRAVDTHVPLYFPLETGTARGMLIPMPRSEGGTTRRWCDPLPNW